MSTKTFLKSTGQEIFIQDNMTKSRAYPQGYHQVVIPDPTMKHYKAHVQIVKSCNIITKAV